MPDLKTRTEYDIREMQAIAFSDAVAALATVQGSTGQFPVFTGTGLDGLGTIGVAAGTDVPTRADADGRYVIQGVGTDWAAATGTELRTALAAYAGQDVSVSYVEAEAQATDDAVKAVSQRLAALINDLIANGTLPVAV